jgi:hypothetical protein
MSERTASQVGQSASAQGLERLARPLARRCQGFPANPIQLLFAHISEPTSLLAAPSPPRTECQRSECEFSFAFWWAAAERVTPRLSRRPVSVNQSDIGLLAGRGPSCRRRPPTHPKLGRAHSGFLSTHICMDLCNRSGRPEATFFLFAEHAAAAVCRFFFLFLCVCLCFN